MIIARIESFILNNGLDDAVERAKAYINAGADGLMIHSKSKEPDEIFSFCEEYQKFDKRVPLIAVPSTYNYITEEELNNRGVDIVIYANHLLRSAYPSMIETAKSILENKRSYETNNKCLSISEILKLIPNG
jgi:phosphoenolpyruvate phosphomutase